MHTADRNDDSSTLEPIRTDRLVLRPYRPDDAGNLLHYYGLANVSRYLLNEPWTLDDAREAVRARESRHVFAEPRVHRVIAQMDARNSGSARLAQRIGMRQEAHFRQNLRIKNKWTDTMVFATLRSERTQANPLTEGMHLRSQQ